MTRQRCEYEATFLLHLYHNSISSPFTKIWDSNEEQEISADPYQAY